VEKQFVLSYQACKTLTFAFFTRHFQGAVVARKMSPKIPKVVEPLIAHGAGESKLLLVFNLKKVFYSFSLPKINHSIFANQNTKI
jgi:hypothetical protein